MDISIEVISTRVSFVVGWPLVVVVEGVKGIHILNIVITTMVIVVATIIKCMA